MTWAMSVVEPVRQDQGGGDAGAVLEKVLLGICIQRFWAEPICYSHVYFSFHQLKLCFWQQFVSFGQLWLY